MSDKPRPRVGPLPIDAFGNGGFRIDGVRTEGHVTITQTGVHVWDVHAQDLAPSDFDRIIESCPKPDIVVLGVGERLVHPAKGVRAVFRTACIGLEVSDTPTACRTYNLLAGEGRHVVAALIAI